MQPVSRTLVDKFSEAFAGRSKGFSARQITEYFSEYSALVRPHDHYAMNPTRLQLFIESVYSLLPDQQYYALNDLAYIEHESRYDYPSDELRNQLRHELHSFISETPIGLSFSEIRNTEFRKDWMTAYSRLITNPAAAVTAARTLLETTFKTIIEERGEVPDNSGDLGRLLRQAQDVLGFIRAENQNEHQIVQGLSSLINGIAAVSNEAGDRHGTVQGVSLADRHLAILCVNACGTVGIAFIEKHLLGNIPEH